MNDSRRMVENMIAKALPLLKGNPKELAKAVSLLVDGAEILCGVIEGEGENLVQLMTAQKLEETTDMAKEMADEMLLAFHLSEEVH